MPAASDAVKRSNESLSDTNLDVLVSSLQRLTKELESQNLLLMQLLANNQEMLEELIGTEELAGFGTDLAGKPLKL